jgi:hypothetical protein
MTRSILLWVTAWALLLLLFIPAVLFSIVRWIWQGARRQDFIDKMDHNAWAVDHFGNALYKDLWNSIMITKGGIPYGDIKEPLSSLIGKNKIRGTQSEISMMIDFVLERIDPNHSIKSIICIFSTRCKNQF